MGACHPYEHDIRSLPDEGSDFSIDGARYPCKYETAPLPAAVRVKNAAIDPGSDRGHRLVAYGFLAAALAELTEGYIFSDDGAWPGPPIRASEFEGRYFRPALAGEYGDAEWYVNCLTRLIEDYEGRPYVADVKLLSEHKWQEEECIRYFPSGRTVPEGPMENDRFIVFHSEYVNFPYAVVNRSMIMVDPAAMVRKLRLLLIRRSGRLSSQPPHAVQEIDMTTILSDPQLTFWANPLMFKNPDAILNQLIDA